MNRDVFPVIFGSVVSTTIAGTLVIAALKAGITPGVSPLVVLVAWGAFAKRATSPGGARFLNLSQVAGSAGMAVTAGVIFTAPLVQILYAEKGLPPPGVDVPTLMILSFAGALIGFGFVGMGTRKFLSDPTLPAPEARACQKMIEAAVAHRSRRPKLGRSLYLGMLAGWFVPLFIHAGLLLDHITLFSRSSPGSSPQDARKFSLDLPCSPLFIGIGGLLTLSTALLVFGGSFLRLAGDWLLSGIPAASHAAAVFPQDSMRWVGGGAMTVAVAFSLLKFARVRMPGARLNFQADDPTLEIDKKKMRWQVASVAAGMAVLLAWLAATGASTTFLLVMGAGILVMALLMVALGAILSLQIGSSASPVSGTIFVTALVLCLLALVTGHHRIQDVLILTPLLVAGCVAVCAANDSSQDYKTLQLCGMRVQDGFLAQLLGLIGGCIVVPVVLYVANRAYTLGSPQLPAPQGKMFATLIDGLLLESHLPWWPIVIGVIMGALTVVMEIVLTRRGLQLPAMALAVGIYLPAALGVGILLGAIFRRVGEGRRETPRNEVILAAAGLVTGAAALELLLGILILAVPGFTPESSLLVFGRWIILPGFVPEVLALLAVVFLGGILWSNARAPREGRA